MSELVTGPVEDDDEDLSPPDMVLDSTPFTVAYHPTREVMVVGLIDGKVELHDPTRGGKMEAAAQPPALARLVDGGVGSCRVALFAGGGDALIAGFEGGELCSWDLANNSKKRGSVSWRGKVEGGALSACVQLGDSPPLFACGDDSGGVSIWDIRRGGSRGAVFSASPHEDFVSGLCVHEGKVLACSADGRLSVSDPRKNLKEVGLSDVQDDELLSITVMKNGRKVVCGTQTGALVVWSWGKWGDSSDRCMGHPESVDALLKVDEDTLCTGSSDGLLRVVRIQPGLQLLGVLGDHDGFPIERLAFSSDRNVVASLSHDPLVRFWDARALHCLDSSPDEEQEDSDMELETSADSNKKSGDASDEEGDDDSDDDSDDSDDSDAGKGKRKKTKKKKAAAAKQRPQIRLKTKAEKFFSGL